MILPIIVRSCLPGAVPERPFAPLGAAASRDPGRGEGRRGLAPCRQVTAPRLRELPRRRVCGRTVPVAGDFSSRLLGLAGLSREEAGAGLLIPRCASVHTFGMRFALDLLFLDRHERPLACRLQVPPRRLLWHRGAVAVLEIPAGQGGELGRVAA
jgi:uncharacterized protein